MELGEALIRVTADGSRFRQDLERIVSSASSGVNANVKLKVDLDAASLRQKIDAATRGAKIKVDWDVDTASLRAKVMAAAASVSPVTVRVRFDLTDLVRTRLLINSLGRAGGGGGGLLRFGLGGAAAMVALGEAAAGAAAAVVAVGSAAAVAATTLTVGLGGALAAVASGAGIVRLAFSNIGEAVNKLKTQDGQAGASGRQLAQSRVASARQIADAERGVADARRALGDALADADRTAVDNARRIASAREALRDAEEESAEAIIEAQERIADAQRDTARAMEAALERVADAERALRDSQEDSAKAQRSLNDARREAIEDLEDLRMRSGDLAVREQQAILDIAEAEAELQRIKDSAYADPNRVRDAELRVAQEKQNLAEIREAHEDAANEIADIESTGGEKVRNATERAADAQEEVVERTDDVADAQRDLQRTQEDTARAMARAQRDLAEVQEDAARRVRDAQEGVAQAGEENARASEQAARRIEDAQRGVADAMRGVAQAHQDAAASAEDFAARTTDALAGLSPAARLILDDILAMQGMMEQLRDTAQVELVGAVDSVRVAFANNFPAINTFVGEVSGSIGEMVENIAGFYAGPEGQVFVKETLDDVAMIAESITGFFEDIDESFRNVTEAAREAGVFEWIAGLIEDLGENILEFTENADMVEFFEKGIEIADKMFAIMGNVGGILMNIFGAAVGPGEEFLGTLEESTQKFEDWTGSAEGQTAIKDFFTELIGTVTDLTTSIGNLMQAYEDFKEFDKSVTESVVGEFERARIELEEEGEIWNRFFTETVPGWFESAKTSIGEEWAGVATEFREEKAIWEDEIFPAVEDFFTKTIPGWFGDAKTSIGEEWGGLAGEFEEERVIWRDQVFPKVETFFTKTVPGWFDTGRTNIGTAWGKVRETISGIFEGWKTNLWPSITDFFTVTIPGWGTSAIDGIAGAFGKLGEKLSGPISTAKTWLNTNLRDPLNKVSEKFGITLPTFADGGQVPSQRGMPRGIMRAYASGGLLRGPGSGTSDSILGVDGLGVPTARVSNGEYVIRKSSVDKYGPQLLEAINTGRYAQGGMVGAGDGFGDLLGKGINAIRNTVEGWIAKGVRFATDSLLNDRTKQLIGQAVPSPAFANETATGSIDWLREEIGKWADGKDKDRAAAGSAGADTGPLGGATGAGGYLWQMRMLRERFPGLAMNSGFRPNAITAVGTRSYHGMGRAVDVPPRMDVFNWIKATYGANTKELIFSPANGAQLLNGRPYMYSGITRSNHFDHVHWAYDDGGVLPPGRTMTANNTGAPEYVQTQRDREEMRELISLTRKMIQAGQRPGININAKIDSPASAQALFQQAEFYDRTRRV